MTGNGEIYGLLKYVVNLILVDFIPCSNYNAGCDAANLDRIDRRHRLAEWSCNRHGEEITYCTLERDGEKKSSFEKTLAGAVMSHEGSTRECLAMTSELVDGVPPNDLDLNLRSLSYLDNLIVGNTE